MLFGIGLELGYGSVADELDATVADIHQFGGDVAFPEGADAFLADDGAHGV